MSHPTRQSASTAMEKGYAKPPSQHLGQRIASAFRHDAEAERLLALRDTDPTAYAALPVGTRTGLAYYGAAREAARSLGQDVSAPASTP